MARDEHSRTGYEGIARYEEEIAALEEETEQKVSHTITAIESAVEAWKAAGRKPPSLKGTMDSLQEFYTVLVRWEKKSLRSKRGRDLEARIERLREFAEICVRYENEKRKGSL